MNELVFEENKLPLCWIRINLENCVEILDSRRIPINSSERQQRQGDIPYFGATDQVGWIDDYIFDEELVLLGEDGAPFFDYLKNKAYLINGKSWINNHAHVLKGITELLTNKFLCYYLNQIDYHKYVNGTTRLKLNQSSMKTIPIILPPLPEQKRIVTKIESIFSQIDAGQENLDNVKKLLKQNKQSVLKNAFGNKKWTYVQLGDFLTLEYGKGLSKKDRKKGSIPVFGSAGINGYHNKALVENSSLIIGRKGNAGNVILVEQSFWAIDTTYFLKKTKDYNIKFLFYLFNYLDFAKLDSSTAIPSLRRDDVYMLNIPFLSMLEQKRIISKIESIFGRIDAIENSVILSVHIILSIKFRILLILFTMISYHEFYNTEKNIHCYHNSR